VPIVLIMPIDRPLTILRDWEQGRVRPDTAARSYLLVISRNPEAVKDALHAA
jgi:putative transcriptional regulator